MVLHIQNVSQNVCTKMQDLTKPVYNKTFYKT